MSPGPRRVPKRRIASTTCSSTSTPELPVELLLRIVQLAAELPLPTPASAAPTNVINDRNTILRNLSLVSRTFRGVAQAVLFGDVHVYWMASTANPLIAQLVANPHLANLVTTVTVVYYPLALWRFEEVSRKRSARRSPEARAAREFSPRPHEELASDALELDRAEDTWNESTDGDWDAEALEGKVHGGVTTLVRLAAAAPRLTSLVLDQFTVTSWAAHFLLANAASAFTALRSLTIGLLQHPELELDYDIVLDPRILRSLINHMPSLTHLSIKASALSWTIPGSPAVAPILPSLTSLDLATCRKVAPTGLLGDLILASPITTLQLTTISTFNLQAWAIVLARLHLTSLHITWMNDDWQRELGDEPTRSIGTYLEASSLVTLGLALSPDVVQRILLHLPPSLELLRFEGFDMSEDWEEGFEYCRAALETALGSLKNRRGLVVEVLFHAGQATAARKRLGDLVGDFEAKEITLKMQELEVSRPGPPMPTE